MTVHLRAGAATAIAAFLLVTSSFAAQTSLASVPRGSQASIAHSDVHPLPIESRSSGELPLDGALSTTSTIQFSVVTTGPVKENDFLGGLAAEFTDTANSTPSASDYGATFDWGDGTVMSTADGTAMITCNDKTTGQCELSVSGHAYADEATQTVTATVYPKGDTPTSASAASDQGTLTVGEADVLSADSTGLIHLSSAHSYSGPVATFTDTGYPSNAASDFTATIDWGDKSSSDGTVTGDGSGTFTVSASHTYASSGPYSVSVTLSEDLQGSAQTTATTTAGTIQFSLITTGKIKENGEFGGLAAEFTDTANSTPSASDYGATFDWGDGTVMSTADGTAMITCNDTTAGQCELSVSGHAYADEATQTVTATVYPKGDTPTSASAASDQGTLTVGEADVLADNSPMAIQASTGQQFSGPVATFTDSGYPSNSASDFTATIGWGDTTSSAGTVTSDGAGDFTVSGQHIYSAPGLETGSVSITDDSPGTASSTTSFTATVNEPPAITSANHATFTAGVAGSFTVTATGSPTPSIAETGGLPSGVTFTDNGNGTATLSGTPAAGTGGTYSISIKATNGASPRAIQSFVLTVVGVSASVTTGPGTVSGSTSCNYASGSSCRQSYNSYLNCLGRAGALNCRGTLIAKTPASFHSRTITTAGVASGQAYMSGTGVLTGVGFVPFSAAFVDNGPGQNGTAVLTINGVTTEYVCRGACNIIRTR